MHRQVQTNTAISHTALWHVRYLGDILVAVNPFRNLPIYTPAFQARYHDIVKSATKPHIYAIADRAYFSLRRMGKDQSVVISGESGAGKTESAKLLIKHIMKLCNVGDVSAVMKKRILQVDHVLEAFGNARTQSNYNSSRFGLYKAIKIDAKGRMAGAHFSHYLLDKSRVVSQVDGKNNFHIFSYIMGLPQSSALGLSNTKEFKYLASSSQLSCENEDMYTKLVCALTDIGFSDHKQTHMHEMTAGLLHLGNIRFSAMDIHKGPAQIVDDPDRQPIPLLSRCFGVEAKALAEALLVSLFSVRGEIVKRPYSCAQAYDARDALARALYGRFFAWLVRQINLVLAPSSSQQQGLNQMWEIGILDILAVESIAKNGFEQMCINVANERLCNFFNQRMFM